jgi:Flp pilus assembly protein TadD
VLLSLLLPAAAHAAWRQASTPHFVIYSEESAESLHAFATRLERFDQAMRLIRNLPDPPIGPTNRLTVYVVPSVAAVQKVMGKERKNLAGAYLPRAGGSIAIVPRRTGPEVSSDTLLLHEYTHHFMMFEGAGAAYPAWYIEGFAELNSTTEFGKDGSIKFGLPAAHRVQGLRFGGIPIEKLLSSGADLKDPRATDAFYARAWLLTHYLSFGKTRPGQLASYLKLVNSGKDSLAAAREAFGDLKQLDQELDKYLNASRLPGIEFTPKQLNIGEIRVRELSAAEDAMMELRIRSDRGVNRVEAQRLLTEMRSAAAKFPRDPSAQAFLAEAEFDAGNHKEAAAAADRALLADPKHVDALIYKGRALMAQAVASGSRDPAAWRDIRGWFLKANKVDAEHAEPLWLYYQSFREAGMTPNSNAVAALLKAHDLAPQDRGLRMAAARQLLVDGKAGEARSMLAPIAYDPHGGASSKLAAALVTLLASVNAKTALQAWDSSGGTATGSSPD